MSKYEWCGCDANASDKEFLGFIHSRLIEVYKEDNNEILKRFDKIIEAMIGEYPTGPKQKIVIDITDHNTVVIKRHGKFIYMD